LPRSFIPIFDVEIADVMTRNTISIAKIGFDVMPNECDISDIGLLYGE
jgi:hypothetical protein